MGWCGGGGVAAAVAAAGAELFKGGAGRAAFRRPWRFFRCRSWRFLRFSSSTECAPLRVNRDRYPQELQFLDKVVDEPMLCNDRCSMGFARCRRASGHASVYGDF